jgi:hypothetical protein
VMCKKEICCLEITIAARIVGILGMVSTFNVRYILETKSHVVIRACCLFGDYISIVKTLEWDYKCAFWLRKAPGSYQPPKNAFGDE